MSISDWEKWAVAAELIRQHGNDGALTTAHERMTDLAIIDRAGFEAWWDIHARMLKLIDNEGPAQLRH